MRAMTQKLLVMGAALSVLAGCTTTATTTSDGGTASDEVIVTASEPSPSAPPPSPPPPPPPSPAPLAEMAGPDRGAATGSPMEKALGEMSTIKPEPPEPDLETVPPPQSGLLTAGDYDDVLNPDLYKAYLDRMLQGELSDKDLPYVDANRRITLKVTDRLGKPFPLTRISLTDADGKPLFPLRTGADGKAYLYPAYDELEAGMTVTASAPGARAMSHVVPADLLKNGGILRFELPVDREPAGKLDLLLTLDATGSMSDEMAYLQQELVAILDRVRSAQPDLDIRAGYIVYRDEGDEYVKKEVAFSSDLDGFKERLLDESARGGGDMPESMDIALKAGLDFDWRDDAVKVNLLVADAPPHDEDIEATWNTGLVSRSRGIHVVSLSGSGIDPTAEFMMRGLSQLTSGRYLFLTDDSGIGLPHAEPTVDCYVVTRLDSLVERVLVSLVTGARVEPEGKDVIRTVGNYQAGVCRLEDDQTS